MSVDAALVRGWLWPDPLQGAHRCPCCGWYTQGRECDRTAGCELPQLVERGHAPRHASVWTRGNDIEPAWRFAEKL